MFLKRVACLALACVATASAQPVGQYVRPSGDQVTGNTNWWVPNHRSPCPAMNSLANHGHINRNGKDITIDMLKKAMKKVFNVDDSVANFITSGLPQGKFTLADLSKHNFIEHDASLVHADVFYKMDPAAVDGGLANDLMLRMREDRKLGKKEIGEALRTRLIWCQQKQGGCDFKSGQRDVTFREAAKLLRIMGATKDNTITVEHLYSFLVLEQFPVDWKKSQQSISLNELNSISVEIQKIAGVA